MEYVTELPQVSPEELDDLLKSQPKVFDYYIDKDVPIFRPVQGTNKIRLLPYPAFPDYLSDKQFNGLVGLRVFIHAFLTPAGDQYLCNRVMKNEPCPFCEVFDKYRNSSWDTAKWYQPRPRILVWVYDLTDRKDSQGNKEVPSVKLWPAPVSVIGEILEIAYDEDEKQYVPLLSLKDGYAISFKMSKNSKGMNEYSGIKLTKPTAVDPEKLQGIIKPWDEILVYYEYEHMKSRMELTVDTKEEESVDEDAEEFPEIDTSSEKIGVSEEEEVELEEDIPF